MIFSTAETVRVKNRDIKIIYEDNHILVTVKPQNIPSQADDSGDDDFLSLMKLYVKEKYNKPGDVYLGLVHRLDRPAGGVMIFARTSKAAGRLSDAMRNQAFDKQYLAVVHGTPPKGLQRLTDYLQKNELKNIVSVVDSRTRGAQEAILEYELIDSKDGMSLVKVDLYTGRSHQIRVQMSNIGHPLYGDQKYGNGLNKPGQQLALWSRELTIEHPVKKEIMTFRALPDKKEPWARFSIPLN